MHKSSLKVNKVSLDEILYPKCNTKKTTLVTVQKNLLSSNSDCTKTRDNNFVYLTKSKLFTSNC